MGAPYGEIMRKCEDAFAALVTQQATGALATLTIYKGMSGTELTSPRIEIVCPDATPMNEADIPSGNWMVTLHMIVVTSFDDKTRDQRENMGATLFDLVMNQDNLAQWINSMSGVADFAMYGGEEGEGEGFRCERIESTMDGSHYFQRMVATVLCRPSA